MVQRRYYRQIVIRFVSVSPPEDDINADIDYMYQCLGLGDERDEVGLLVFRALVKSGPDGISSRDIMSLGEMSQAAVIYHLNLFQRSGLVVKDGRSYYLRGFSLSNALDELENDMHRRFEHLKALAKKIEVK
jgi:hypothetical protein